MARDHPFIDRNRRTAAVACEAFIVLDGATLAASDLALYPMYPGLSEGSVEEREFATWLGQLAAPTGERKLREGAAPYG